MTERSQKQIDVSGVCCPLPLIHLAQAVASMKPGEILLIRGNDPIFEPTVRDFCHAHGHAVVDVRQGESRQVSLRIRVGG